MLGLLLVGATCAAASGGAAGNPTPAIVFAADRAPLLSGEVYRLDSDGRTVDLSKSPFRDTAPAVSPNGKSVAFASDRDGGGNGRAGIYVAAIDGSGLQRLNAPRIDLLNEQQAMLAWAPDSKKLALVSENSGGPTLSIVGPGRRPIVLARRLAFEPSWSPDSRLVTAALGPKPEFRTYRAGGGLAWRVPYSDGFFHGWSRHGLYLAILHNVIRAYDERGRVRLRSPGRAAVWSDDGKRVASIAAGRVEVRTSGGRVLFRKAYRGLAHRRTGLVWAGGRHVALNLFGHLRAVDIVTGKTSSAPLRVFGRRSPNGRFVVDTVRHDATFDVRVFPLEGEGSQTYGSVGGCFDDGGYQPNAQSIEFVPGRKSLVYESYCAEPPSALYTVDPGGGAVTSLTSGIKQYVTPRWSPDGSQLAFTRFDYTGQSCKGCPGSIWIANADGSNARLLVSGDEANGESALGPSWSPDRATVLFTRTSFSAPGELFVVPAAGGTPHDLGIAGYGATWGPTRIAWVDIGTVPTSYWTARPDGSDRRKVGEASGSSLPSAPAWSADGRLAFATGPHTVGILTGGATQTVQLPFDHVTSLDWSPDGSRFVVGARAAGTASFDIYTVRTDGSNPNRLTTDLDAGSPSWR